MTTLQTRQLREVLREYLAHDWPRASILAMLMLALDVDPWKEDDNT